MGATWLYVGAEGQTEPDEHVSNYMVGVRFRRQAYRDFLFWEVEPSYNWRIDEPFFDREGAWKIALRLEFLLFAKNGFNKTAHLAPSRLKVFLCEGCKP